MVGLVRHIRRRFAETQGPSRLDFEDAERKRSNLLIRAVDAWSFLRSVALNVLGTLLFLGVAILLYQAVMSSTIEVLPISVPTTLSAKGYSSEAVSRQLRAALFDLVKEAATTERTAEIVLQGDEPKITLPETGISVDAVAAEIRARLGVENTAIVSGSIESVGDRLKLVINLDHKGNHKRLVVFGSFAEFDELLPSAASGIFSVIDPYVVAASFAQKDRKKSIELARQIISTYPPHDEKVARAHILVSSLQLNSGAPDEAEREAAKAIKSKPDIPDGYVSRGNALMYKRETILAIDDYKKAITIDKNNAFAHNNLGRAYREQGKTQNAVDEYNKKAIDEYNKAVTIDSHDPYAHLNLGSVFYDKGSPTQDFGFLTQAIDEYKTAIAIDPRNSDAHVRLGLAFRAEGKHEEEKNEYDNALAISALRHF